MSEELLRNLMTWLATYLLHSTVLLGAVWLLLKSVRRLSDASRESLWRAAMLGGILTATAQWGFGFDTLGGQWQVPWLTANAVAEELPIASQELAPPITTTLESNAALMDVAPAPEPAAIETAAAPSLLADWRWRFALAIVLVAIISAPVTVLSWLRLNRLLGSREPLADPDLLDMLLELRRRAGVKARLRLSVSDSLLSPVAFGVFRPEICLPRRAVESLAASQQRSLLAHELAHHARRDPLWLGISRLIVSVLFFQPLNRIAQRSLQEIAEFRCDAWAIAQTGCDLSLARCLANVASWIVGENKALAAQPVAAMAANESVLRRRIARLVEERSRGRRRTFAPPLIVLLGLLLTVAALTPALGAARTEIGSEANPGSLANIATDAGEVTDMTGEAIDLLAMEIALLRDELSQMQAALEGAADPELASIRQRIIELDQTLQQLQERQQLLRNLWLTSAATEPATAESADASAGSPPIRTRNRSTR